MSKLRLLPSGHPTARAHPAEKQFCWSRAFLARSREQNPNCKEVKARLKQLVQNLQAHVKSFKPFNANHNKKLNQMRDLHNSFVDLQGDPPFFDSSSPGFCQPFKCTQYRGGQNSRKVENEENSNFVISVSNYFQFYLLHITFYKMLCWTGSPVRYAKFQSIRYFIDMYIIITYNNIMHFKNILVKEQKFNLKIRSFEALLEGL